IFSTRIPIMFYGFSLPDDVEAPSKLKLTMQDSYGNQPELTIVINGIQIYSGKSPFSRHSRGSKKTFEVPNNVWTRKQLKRKTMTFDVSKNTWHGNMRNDVFK